jgi:signal recognition particle receptor subunit beta
MILNWQKREMQFKIVYYGPGLSGKTTNIVWLHSRMVKKSQLVSIKTEQERTLFFDFMDFEIKKLAGFSVKFNLYTVPGQTFYVQSRRIVLSGADGVVYVADSLKNRMRENIQYLMECIITLKKNGINPCGFPFVLQYNKRDMKNVLPVEILEKYLNPKMLPSYTSVASDGIGVIETLQGVIREVVNINMPKFILMASRKRK